MESSDEAPLIEFELAVAEYEAEVMDTLHRFVEFYGKVSPVRGVYIKTRDRLAFRFAGIYVDYSLSGHQCLKCFGSLAEVDSTYLRALVFAKI